MTRSFLFIYLFSFSFFNSSLYSNLNNILSIKSLDSFFRMKKMIGHPIFKLSPHCHFQQTQLLADHCCHLLHYFGKSQETNQTHCTQGTGRTQKRPSPSVLLQLPLCCSNFQRALQKWQKLSTFVNS